MAEEHILLMDEGEEKPENHERPKRKQGKWFRKPKLLAMSRPYKKPVIIRSKSSSFLKRFFSIGREYIFSFNNYCKYSIILIMFLLVIMLYTHHDAYSSKQPKPSIISKTSLPLSSDGPNSRQNSTNFHQIYYTNSSVQNHLINVSLPACPPTPQHLVGRLKVLKEMSTFDDIEFVLPNVGIGGHYAPEECVARDKVAIIVPYRSREKHLVTLLANIHPMLMRQNIDYTIFIVEQVGNGSFNRAKLFNVGYFEANKQMDFDCYIFHDVDLVPEDDRNLYTCPQQNSPRHMSVAVDKFKYKLPYKTIFGGVCALTKQQMIKVNGFSNEFWGWGGEDDDMYKRIAFQSWKIERYGEDIARYTMLKHAQQTQVNNKRFTQLKKTTRLWKQDGLNSCKYKIESIVYKKLFTHVLVDLFHP